MCGNNTFQWPLETTVDGLRQWSEECGLKDESAGLSVVTGGMLLVRIKSLMGYALPKKACWRVISGDKGMGD